MFEGDLSTAGQSVQLPTDASMETKIDKISPKPPPSSCVLLEKIGSENYHRGLGVSCLSCHPCDAAHTVDTENAFE